MAKNDPEHLDHVTHTKSHGPAPRTTRHAPGSHEDMNRPVAGGVLDHLSKGEVARDSPVPGHAERADVSLHAHSQEVSHAQTEYGDTPPADGVLGRG